MVETDFEQIIILLTMNLYKCFEEIIGLYELIYSYMSNNRGNRFRLEVQGMLDLISEKWLGTD